MWVVKMKRKQERKLAALPDNVQNLYQDLKEDLKHQGPENLERINITAI